MRRKKRTNWLLIFLGVVIIIILIIVTFGQFKPKLEGETKTDNNKITTDELRKIYQETIVKLKAESEILFKKSKKRFNIIYFCLRLFFVFIWLGINFSLYYLLNIKDIGLIINYNNIFLLVGIVIIFLIFGRLTTLKEFIENIKERIELRVFRQHHEFQEYIGEFESKLNKLDNSELKESNH